MENCDLGPKEDDPIWQANNPQETEEEPEPDEDDDRPVCDQCGKPSEQLLEKRVATVSYGGVPFPFYRTRLICRKCDDDNRMDAAEVQHGE